MKKLISSLNRTLGTELSEDFKHIDIDIEGTVATRNAKPFIKSIKSVCLMGQTILNSLYRQVY
jgi:hypothetical protein